MSTQELTAALADVERMIHAYAHAWQRRNPEMELADLAQEGRLGFCRAFARYQPDAGCKLSTFATPYIQQAMRRCVHFTRDTIRNKSSGFEGRIPMLALEAPWGAEGADAEDTLADCLAAPEPERLLSSDAELCRLVKEAIETLPEKQKRVITGRFAGRTFGSIGKDMGVSREAVRKLYLVALADLRNNPTLKHAA